MVTSAPEGHKSSFGGRLGVYKLWIENPGDAEAIPIIFLEVFDLGSAQSGVKCQVGDLTGETQIWGFSASFLSGNRLFRQFHQ